MRNFQAGNSTREGLIAIAILIVIILVVYRPGAPDGPRSSLFGTATSSGNNISSPSLSGSGGNTQGAVSGSTISAASPDFSKYVYIGTGNAPYAYQSYEEYITIDNWSDKPLRITGWQLKNGKNMRAYNINGVLQYFSADLVTIPQGTLFISPSGNHLMQDIVLNRGETAIITTGSANQNPFRIVSFKENICSGYLGNMPEYNFTPQLSQNCPQPRNEPGLSGLDSACRRFVERLSSCRVPAFDDTDREGEPCDTCIKGERLSSSCAAFIKSHFSYQGCIANHVNDDNFSGNTWRVFLGRGWEMWDRDYETITIFDYLGRLITEKSY